MASAIGKWCIHPAVSELQIVRPGNGSNYRCSVEWGRPTTAMSRCCHVQKRNEKINSKNKRWIVERELLQMGVDH